MKDIGNEAAGVAQHSGIERLIAAHVKTQPSAREPWSVRLQVVPGDPVQLQVGRSTVCPVERLAEGQPAFTPRLGVVSRSDMDDMRRAGEFVVIVDVGPTGKVVTARLPRGSGSRIVDDLALKAARDGRYRPASVDGIPVAGRYEIRSRARVGGN